MAQCNDLGLHDSLASKADEKGIEQHYKVKHGGRRLTTAGRKSKNSNADLVSTNGF